MLYDSKYDFRAEANKDNFKDVDSCRIISPSVSAELPPIHSTVHGKNYIAFSPENIILNIFQLTR
jgi:hypothetical protein